jgi:hypothetical protein
MKFWPFLKWQWNRMEFWMKSYLFAMTMIGIGVATDNPSSKYFFSLGICILCFWAIKWFIFDEIKRSYDEFKKEQNNLFSQIKNSDNK